MWLHIPRMPFKKKGLFILTVGQSSLLRRLSVSWGEQRLLPRCSAWTSCGGFSCCRARALGYGGFRGCGSWAPENWLGSGGVPVEPLCGMWNFPGAGI